MFQKEAAAIVCEFDGNTYEDELKYMQLGNYTAETHGIFELASFMAENAFIDTAMTRNRLQAEMIHISETEDCTIIFVTHNIQEAIVMGTRIIVMGKGGNILVDKNNPIQRPVSPSSPGYADLWNYLHDALY